MTDDGNNSVAPPSTPPPAYEAVPAAAASAPASASATTTPTTDSAEPTPVPAAAEPVIEQTIFTAPSRPAVKRSAGAQIVGGLRMFVVGSFVFLASTIICFSMFLFWGVIHVDHALYMRMVAFHKRLYCSVLIATLQAFGSPKFEITSDYVDDIGSKSATKVDNNSSEDENDEEILTVRDLLLPRSTVVVANHQIYTDWIYMWVFAYYAKSAEHIVIMLKSSLKDLPIFGWGMQIFEFIFLDRRWANDKVTIDKHIEMIHESELPTWLMLYPEGTVPSGNTVPKSLKYASDNKVSHPTNLLLPRSTGLHYTINQLRSDPRIKYLTDLTIGYSGLAKGEIPHYIYTIPGYYMYSDAPDTVHFHVRKIRIDSIPEDEEEFAKWTRKLWMDKDELLNVFYETGKFPAGGLHANSRKIQSGEIDAASNVASKTRYQFKVRTKNHVLIEVGQLALLAIPQVFTWNHLQGMLGDILGIWVYAVISLTVVLLFVAIRQ